MMRSILAVTGSLTAALFIMSGCGVESGPEEDVQTAALSSETRELSIRVSIGSEFGDSSKVFGAIADVCTDARGNILVLDQVARGVKVFGRDGEYICQIGRGGEGPGEMQMPMYLTCLNNGTIMVNDPMNNAYVSFDSTYTYIENISGWSNGPPVEMVAIGDSCYGGILLQFDMERDQPAIIRQIGRFSDSNEPELLFYSDEVPFDFTDFTGALTSMIFSFTIAGDRDGRLFFAPISSEAYRVYGFGPDGEDLLDIRLDLPPVEKSRQEMEDEILYIETWAGRMGMQGIVIEWEPDPHRNYVNSMGVDDMDRLWVARGTELEPVFDVFDMQGSHLFCAVLPVAGRSWKFHMDRWGIIGWEDDPVDGYQQLHLIDFPGE